jgi:membrane dipeptidase
VDQWVSRGVRLFGLVHGFDNQLAGSSSTGTDRGLTPRGREVVRRVHRAGALVDVSHASDAATADVLELAQKDGVPVVATHSNARALHAHARNLTDDQIRAIAASGGIVGVNFHARFLTDRAKATLEDVVRHVRHIAKIGGIDHVAIGSDFEGGIRPPRELSDVRGFPRLSRALLEAGLSREDVTKVFHRNALRVLCPAGKPRGGAAR